MGVSDWNWSKSVTHTKIMVVYWLCYLLDLEKTLLKLVLVYGNIVVEQFLHERAW